MMTITPDDITFMQQALELAKRAYDHGEVPVGAVLVEDGKVIGEGWNQPISARDATAHAEVVALRSAGQFKDNYRLPNTTLYVTLEPCTMCVGALIHSRVNRLVVGALEPKAGAVCSQLQLLGEDHWNHSVEVVSGVLAEESSALLTDFFKMRRAQKAKDKASKAQIT